MNYKVNSPGGLNVRSGPGIEYEVLGTLANGRIIDTIDTSVWLPFIKETDTEGTITLGWVSTKYMVKTAEKPAVSLDRKTGMAVVAKAMTQSGDPYIFGYEVKLDDPNPPAFDCSELVQWVCHQLGVTPEMPDGAANQHDHCKNHGTLISVSQAVKTPGALLFRISEGGNHVVISRGDGSTIEAKGKDYGVGVFGTSGRGWTAAGLIPGVQY